MDISEMVELIRPAVATQVGVWADFGAGSGNFTRALNTLLGPESTIYAVDKDRFANQIAPNVHRIQADFTRPLDLPPLDGLLIANALHFVPAQMQTSVMAHLSRLVRSGGRFVIVEYELANPLSYVPISVPFARFASLAESIGLKTPTQVGTRRSPRTGTSMYAGMAFVP